MWKVQHEKREAEKRARQEKATALLSMDYFLMELHDALQEGCEKKVEEAKKQLTVIHESLSRLGYFQKY